VIEIVADHKIPFLKGAFEGVARVEYLPGGTISRSDLSGADALITRTRTRCDRKLLEGTPVRFIASATIGTDHIDAAYCAEKGIQWANAPGCNAYSVQQYIVSTLLYLATHRSLDLQRQTLGVVGVGNVGSKVARAAEALGMKVLLNDPPRSRTEGPGGFVDLEELLERSDVITLHVPLNREGMDRTWHLVDETFLKQVRRGAILINSSRGEVVDEQALMREIGRGTLGDTVLDVFENEPRIQAKLLPLLILATPHIAGYSLDGKANGTAAAVRAVSSFFGLGLDRWEPAGLPVPEPSELLADASQGTMTEILWEIYRQTYDITSDDRRLRADPGSFEEQRGEYPLRREPPAYSVRLFQGYREIRETLEQLGFSVLSDYCA